MTPVPDSGDAHKMAVKWQTWEMTLWGHPVVSKSASLTLDKRLGPRRVESGSRHIFITRKAFSSRSGFCLGQCFYKSLQGSPSLWPVCNSRPSAGSRYRVCRGPRGSPSVGPCAWMPRVRATF